MSAYINRHHDLMFLHGYRHVYKEIIPDLLTQNAWMKY